MNDEFRLSKVSLISGIIVGVLFTPLFGIGLIVILVSVLNYMSTKVIVSSQSVTLQKGLFNKSSTEIPLHRVREHRPLGRW
jgi:uncharacterized membrane protein YdbT with pleckstrin-like domain